MVQIKNGKKIREVEIKLNNVNRMLQTAKSGLEKIDSKYTLRLRTDIILNNVTFLEYWDKFPCYNGKYKIFKHRIINNSTFAQFAHVMKKGIELLPFHMSDWIHFGLTEDVKLLYSCPFHDIDKATQYWFQKDKTRKQFCAFPDAGWQYPPEQHILYELVKKYFPHVKYEDLNDYNQENMSISNLVIADNFIMLDDDCFAYSMNKYDKLYDWPPELYNGFITHREWQYLYKVYCDTNYSFNDIDYKRLNYYKPIFNFKFFFKYPGKYIRLFKDITYVYNKNKLRKAFYIGREYETY